MCLVVATMVAVTTGVATMEQLVAALWPEEVAMCLVVATMVAVTMGVATMEQLVAAL